jgi:hypothetical protein
MAAVLLAALEPIGIVERAAAESSDVRKALQIEADGRRASAAEIHCNALATGIGPMVIGFQWGSVEYHVLPSEDRFDKICRPRQPLAEGAMADGDAQRLRRCSVADLAAQAPSLMNNRHCLSKAACGQAFPDGDEDWLLVRDACFSELKSQFRNDRISGRGGVALDLTRK